jgi:hypothetical protein
MKLSFLCPERVRKISVASYMWFLFRILGSVRRLDHSKEQGTVNGMSYLLTLNASSGALKRNAVHWPETRKSVVKKACAMFSGRTNLKKRIKFTIQIRVKKKRHIPDLTCCTGLWG